MGKTAMAVNTVALNVARTGKAVLVFSLEMGRVKLVQRMVCAEGRVDSRRMDDDKLEPDEWSRLIVAAQSLKGLPVYVDDQSDSTMATILAKARRIASKVRKLPAPGEDGKHLELGLVVIDYLQFVCVEDGKHRTREEAVASISRDAKRLARRLDVPVLMLAQLNRGVEQRTKKNAQPRLSDLRESGAIEQDADGVIFLHEDDDDPPPPTKPTKMLAIVAKGRHRGTGIAAIGFTKAFVRFDNLEQDDNEYDA
jgi:replicative DNA helicase